MLIHSRKLDESIQIGDLRPEADTHLAATCFKSRFKGPCDVRYEACSCLLFQQLTESGMAKS